MFYSNSPVCVLVSCRFQSLKFSKNIQSHQCEYGVRYFREMQHLKSTLGIQSASPRLPDRLNVFFSLHPQWGYTGVPWICWALVCGGWRAHRAEVGQVCVVSQGWGTEKGGRQGRRHGRRRWRGVSPRESLWAADEAWQWLQGCGGGERGGEPGVQLQSGAQGAAGRAAEWEQRGGGVLELDGTHLQLLLPTPLGSPVLKPHLKTKNDFISNSSHLGTTFFLQMQVCSSLPSRSKHAQ